MIATKDIDSLYLLTRLKAFDLLKDSPQWWWPNVLSFEVVVGAILTQNTKWKGVQTSLENLKRTYLLTQDSEESLYNIHKASSLESYIVPSGLYRKKSACIISLARAIVRDFGSFTCFVDEVSREWLLQQKGIGNESADTILNYACGREIMVVDSYTAKLLNALGYEMTVYEDIQQWCMDLPHKKLAILYPDMPLSQIFARYHGKIVEFSKTKYAPQILLT